MKMAYRVPRAACVRWLSIFVALLCRESASFTVTLSHGLRRHRMRNNGLRMASDDLFKDIAVTVRTSELTDLSGDVLEDKNGKQFKVGSLVRVCEEDLKAYQVNPKGKGAYNDDKIFVKDAEARFLALPVGLRGKVTKIYDENVVSANLPVCVKFSPGKDVDEGFDSPIAFLMHFMPHEIECV